MRDDGAVPTSGLTPRQRARADNLVRIRALALDQLAAGGAADLSLRAIARELNIVPSAIYRYYPGRDELITDLVVEAYGELAARMDTARSARRTPRRRFEAVCKAMRAWAVAEPHRFALLYGSAIPGYAAPPRTIEPASRVLSCFLDSVPEDPTGVSSPRLARGLERDLTRVGSVMGSPGTPATTLVQVGAFAEVIGLLTLELNGHLVGGFEPADALFSALVKAKADALGL